MPLPTASPRQHSGNRWRGLVVGLLALAGLAIQAQAPALRRFDQHDGLPQSQVLALLEDRSGFLWVATMDGIARLGPNGFHSYDSSLGLGIGQVQALMEDREGSIWAACTESGVTRIRGRQVTRFGPDQGLNTQDTYCLMETRAGEIYAGTRMGLFRLRGERFEQQELPGNWKYSPIFALAQDTDNRLLLGSRNGALAAWDGHNLQVLPLPPQPNPRGVISLRVDPEGSVWLLQADRLLRREKGNWRTEPLPGLPPIVRMNSLSFSTQGELIITLGSDGLYLRGPDGQGHRFETRDGYPRDPRCALRDRHGVLWIGTNGDHLHALVFAGLKSLTRNLESRTAPEVGSANTFQELPGNRMLIGSSTGVTLWEKGRGLTRQWRHQDGLPVDLTWALCTDGKGGSWVGTGKGLAHLDAGGNIHPGPKELAATQVNKLLAKEDRLWAATDQGLMELDLAGRFLAKHTPPQEVGYPDIFTLTPRPGSLLVGTQVGLYSFKDGQFRKAYPKSPMTTSSITTVHEDPHGELWVATPQGLFTRDRKSQEWTAFPPGNDRPLNGVNWISTLPSGAIAVGHGRGVLMVDKGATLHLTRRLGLISDETNQEAAFIDHRGSLWMGMVGGACILEPSSILSPVQLPPPVVMEVTWEGGSAWRPKDLTLPPRTASLAIAFDTGMPSTPFPPRYEVRLKGQDSGWRQVEAGTTSVQFGRLDPGSYQFQVRATLDGRSWVESLPLDLQVRRAWFQTLWARTLFLLGGITTILALIKWRLDRLEKRNQELEDRIATRTHELALRNRSMERLHHQLKRTLESRMEMVNTVSHDLRSPLTSILLSVDRIQDSTGEMAPELAKTLGVLDREARRLESIVKALLDRSRSESMTDSLNQRLCHPSEVLDGLTDTLRLKAEARDLRSHLDLDPADDQVWILGDTTGLQQTLFNLLENALKFTEPPGLVGVRSRVEGTNWVLEVWDTGRGIEPEKLELIFKAFQQTEVTDAHQGWGLGLAICKTMVEGHAGRLEVESEPGKGSLFRMTLPLVVAGS